MYLFGWINQSGDIWPFGATVWALYRRKLLSLVFLCTPRCNSLNAKRFIHVSLRLNKLVMGHMDLRGYCLGPSTGESCCCWCFCLLQHVILLIQKDSSMYLFGWITPYECGPLGLLSGAKYRKNCCHCYFQYKYSPMSGMRQSIFNISIHLWVVCDNF